MIKHFTKTSFQSDFLEGQKFKIKSIYEDNEVLALLDAAVELPKTKTIIEILNFSKNFNIENN